MNKYGAAMQLNAELERRLNLVCDIAETAAMKDDIRWAVIMTAGSRDGPPIDPKKERAAERTTRLKFERGGIGDVEVAYDFDAWKGPRDEMEKLYPPEPPPVREIREGDVTAGDAVDVEGPLIDLKATWETELPWWALGLIFIFICFAFGYAGWMMAGDIQLTSNGVVRSRWVTTLLIVFPWMIGIGFVCNNGITTLQKHLPRRKGGGGPRVVPPEIREFTGYQPTDSSLDKRRPPGDD